MDNALYPGAAPYVKPALRYSQGAVFGSEVVTRTENRTEIERIRLFFRGINVVLWLQVLCRISLRRVSVVVVREDEAGKCD